MKYTVQFILFGKTMKTSVEATSEDEAMYKVLGEISKKVVWEKIEPQPVNIDEDPLEFLKQTFGMK